MAEKILQTRIINKHADLATWKDSTLPLKTGEIALARVETTKPDGHGGFYTVPTYLMKVGDDNKTFSQLEWLAAPASDVYEWAKASTKPSYNAGEIARGTSTTAGTVAGDLKAAEEAITALQTAIGGSGSVATMIQTAIQALDENTWAAEDGIKFVTAVGETDGKISVTRRALTADDIPTLEISKINGLQGKLDLKANAADVKQTTDAISARLDENGDIDVAIKAAKKAGDDAQSYAEGVAEDLSDYETSNNAEVAAVRAIAEAATTVEEATSIAQGKVEELANGQVKTNKEAIAANNAAIAALAGDDRTTETVKGNADAIAKLAQDIGNVANIMNFRGVSTGTNPGDGITDPQNGDVIIFGEAEYVYDGSNWIKFGDASDNATAISDLQTRVGTVETRLNTGDIHEAIVAAKSAADTADDKAEAAQLKADANEAAISVINGNGAGSISKAVEDAKTELKSYADTAESDAVTAAKGYTDGEIDKVEESITNLTTTVGNNKTAAENATKAVADDLAAYVTSNDAALDVVRTNAQKGVDDAADALQAVTDLANGQVKTNKENIEALDADITTIENNYARVSGDKLVYGQGAAEMTIIFDCGGAE